MDRGRGTGDSFGSGGGSHGPSRQPGTRVRNAKRLVRGALARGRVGTCFGNIWTFSLLFLAARSRRIVRLRYYSTEQKWVSLHINGARDKERRVLCLFSVCLVVEALK